MQCCNSRHIHSRRCAVTVNILGSLLVQDEDCSSNGGGDGLCGQPLCMSATTNVQWILFFRLKNSNCLLICLQDEDDSDDDDIDDDEALEEALLQGGQMAQRE